MKKLKLNTILCILILAFSNLYAFDGERKGFILGGGVGFGYFPTSIYLNISCYPAKILSGNIAG